MRVVRGPLEGMEAVLDGVDEAEGWRIRRKRGSRSRGVPALPVRRDVRERRDSQS